MSGLGNEEGAQSRMAPMFMGNWRGSRPFTDPENSVEEREYLKGEFGRWKVEGLRIQAGAQ